jgi:hypothetical protein
LECLVDGVDPMVTSNLVPSTIPSPLCIDLSLEGISSSFSSSSSSGEVVAAAADEGRSDFGEGQSARRNHSIYLVPEEVVEEIVAKSIEEPTRLPSPAKSEEKFLSRETAPNPSKEDVDGKRPIEADFKFFFWDSERELIRGTAVFGYESFYKSEELKEDVCEGAEEVPVSFVSEYREVYW